MNIETCDLEGDALEDAVSEFMRYGPEWPNERHCLMEAAGHFSRRNPDAPTRDHPQAYVARISDDHWVTADDPLTAIKRAYVLSQRSTKGAA